MQATSPYMHMHMTTCTCPHFSDGCRDSLIERSSPPRHRVLHVRKLGMPFVVACMDESLFQLSERSGYSAVMMKEDAEGSSKVNTRWKYYRMDPKAFLEMGILKVCLAASPK